MRHPKTVQWEKKLDRIFHRIDKYLEDKYGDLYPLHPVRAKRKRTGNPASDGLFRVGSTFSAGFGSEKGPGYIVRIEMMTLERISPDIQEHIDDDVAERLRHELPKEFPSAELRVERDGHSHKIFGDLRLGRV